MALAKKEYFDGELVELADIARALAHPVRIQILSILAGRNSCMCGEMVDLLPLAQSTVSQHLKALKKSGLITGNIEGPKVCYCLDRDVLDKARKSFSHLFSELLKSK